MLSERIHKLSFINYLSQRSGQTALSRDFIFHPDFTALPGLLLAPLQDY